MKCDPTLCGKSPWTFFCLTLCALAFACHGQPPQSTGAASLVLVDNIALGASDGVESVKILPEENRAIAISAKSRRITALTFDEAGLSLERDAVLFSDDSSDSELTSIALAPDASRAFLTRTLPATDTNGEITQCTGSVVIVDISPNDAFGTVLAEVPVGPMPDALAVSKSGQWLAVANERDAVWGKCEGVVGLAQPSISLIDISEGASLASEVLRVEMTGDDGREPESLAFDDHDQRLIVSLQDSHEIAVLDIQTLLQTSSDTQLAVHYSTLPSNSAGTQSWPDGITAFSDNGGHDWFVAAGEGNDTLIYGRWGNLEFDVIEIGPQHVSATFPTDGTWGPLYRPDSITTFVHNDRRYVATTLKASGALALWDFSDPQHPLWQQTLALGIEELAGPDSESSIQPEGLSARNGFILVANEGESSLSLLHMMDL